MFQANGWRFSLIAQNVNLPQDTNNIISNAKVKRKIWEHEPLFCKKKMSVVLPEKYAKNKIIISDVGVSIAMVVVKLA